MLDQISELKDVLGTAKFMVTTILPLTAAKVTTVSPLAKDEARGEGEHSLCPNTTRASNLLERSRSLSMICSLAGNRRYGADHHTGKTASKGMRTGMIFL